jgi:hypothetical protein
MIFSGFGLRSILWISMVGIKVLLTILMILIFSCSREDDAVLVHSLIEKGAALAEAHDVKGILSLTSDNFYAQPGRRNRQETGAILRMAFKHYGSLKVLYPRPSITVEQTTQTASGSIYFMIIKKERAYPDLKALYEDPMAWLAKAGENADLYRLNLGLKKYRGEWLVESAHLEPFKGLRFGS